MFNKSQRKSKCIQEYSPCSEGGWRFESPLNLLLMEYPRDLTTLGLYRNISGESWYCPTRAYFRCCQSRTWHVVELSIMLCPPENNPTCFMWVVYKKMWCWPYQNVKMSPIWWILGSFGLCKVFFEKLSNILFDKERLFECCSTSRLFHSKSDAKEN